MARTSRLVNNDLCKAVAEAYINGCSRKEMAEMFGCHEDTVTHWTKDPRVQAHAGRFALERVNRITRKIDGEIEARLDDVDNWDVDVLLKVRKEYLDRSLKIDLTNVSKAEATNEVLNAIEQDEDLEASLRELLARK